jgi:hypothetical protein
VPAEAHRQHQTLVTLCVCWYCFQVWALQQGPNVYVVGRSNRSKVLFEQEVDAVIDAVPELPLEQAAAAAPVSAAAKR